MPLPGMPLFVIARRKVPKQSQANGEIASLRSQQRLPRLRVAITRKEVMRDHVSE